MSPIVRIIIVLVTAGIICEAAYVPIRKGLTKYYHHDSTRFTEIFEKSTPYDLVFLGSSRTHMSIYPRIIDSICSVNSYNAGVEGAMVPDIKMVLQGYLINHPAPKVMVMTLDLNAFSRENEIFYYPQYYPYINNSVVKSTLSSYGYHVYLVGMLPFIAMTDLDDYSKGNAVKALLGSKQTDMPLGDFDYKGFMSNTDSYILKSEPEGSTRRLGIFNSALTSLDEMIELCHQKNIKLIFTYAPEFEFNLQKNKTNKDSVFTFISLAANKNNIPFLRDDSLEICSNPKLFKNNGHLNKPGAIVYSAILAGELDKLLGKTSKPSR